MPTRVTRRRARVLARARPLETALNRWLLDAARMFAAREVQGLAAKARTKTEATLRRELEDLLLRFGLRTAADAATNAAREAGAEISVRGANLANAIDRKPTKIQWFWEYRDGVFQRVDDILESTRDEVRASVRRILADAAREERVPSQGEIARRIHSQFHGAEREGRIRVFSPERASVIAQTELAQAENTGAVEGYKAAGVEEIEWLARPGSERHGSLSGKRVKLGERFTAANGDRLRYPGDPSAPIRSTINCRCVVAPVIRRRA